MSISTASRFATENMRWLILIAVLMLGLAAADCYRRDQADLRAHLEQRDARHREIQERLDEVSNSVIKRKP